jgi:hypothetical protein
MEDKQKFDRNKSVLCDLYISYSANDPGELIEVYTKADQELMRSSHWDYNDASQATNIIKSAIEKVGLDAIPDRKEKEWLQDILWFWYHHATSCALDRYGDKSKAQEFSKKAFELHLPTNPNKITKLLYLLTHDELDEAKKWAETIDSEPEKSTAQKDLEAYNQGVFFEKK